MLLKYLFFFVIIGYDKPKLQENEQKKMEEV